jgi:hypothetical protein
MNYKTGLGAGLGLYALVVHGPNLQPLSNPKHRNH